LLALDLLIALALSGRLAGLRRAGAAVGLGLSALLIAPMAADAQTPRDEAQSQAEAAALRLRFGYIRTGDDALDARMRSGLFGLSHVLFLRTSVEPADPHGLDPVSDALELYPLIYYALPENVDGPALSEEAIAALNRYMRTGGALVIDTREGGSFEPGEGSGTLAQLLDGLDVPPLVPVPDDHVLTKSFYLLDAFPGRFEGAPLWIEATARDGGSGGDGVSRLFVGDADWAGAWAVDQRTRRPLFAVDGGERQREMARRFGINLVMYVLTGNYKSDQVHLPALLERLGKNDDDARDSDGAPSSGETDSRGPR